MKKSILLLTMTFTITHTASAFIFQTAASFIAYQQNVPDPRPFTMPEGYVCQRTKKPILIDGKLDEKAWKKTKWTGYFVDIEGKDHTKPLFKTRAKMLWDDNYFYIAAELEDPHVWATLTEKNSVIFNDNDFEVFIDPDGDSHHYYEFEMNALNTIWNLFLERPYKNGVTAKIRDMPNLKTAVHVNGTLNDPTDIDKGWTLEIAFAWKDLAQHAHTNCPPKDGDYWRVDFSRVQWRYRIKDGKYIRVPSPEERTETWQEDNWVWSPQGVISMHRPETWGYVQFSKKPAGKKVPFRPDPSAHARYILHQIHYAQAKYHAVHNKYAQTLAELQLENIDHKSLAAPIRMKVDNDTYKLTATIKYPNQKIKKLTITPDARIK